MAAAPHFTLPSIAAGPVSLNELITDGRALLVFVSEECPTSMVTLRRLAPVLPGLREAGVCPWTPCT